MRDELSLVKNQNVNNATERIFMTRDTNNEIELETFSSENRRIHPMQFLNRTREFNRFNSSSWEVKLLKILKCFKGSAEIWAEVHNVEWGSFEDFEVAFRNKYWSEEDQEILRSKIMGSGNFGRMNNHLTIYVMNIYNEAKYLEPPLPFRSFVRHVSKHLPREVQITLMTKEITNISELENMLDVLQNIGAVSYTHLDVYKRQVGMSKLSHLK